MWPIDVALKTALAGRDRPVVCAADVTLDGAPVLTGLRVSAGTLTVSSGTPRRSVSLTLVDDDGDLVPAATDDALAPYGNEITVRAGLRVAGVDLTVPVGVCRVQKAVSSTAGGAVTVAVTAVDRSQRVADDALTDYVSIADGTLITDAITTLVSDSLPDDQVYSFTPLSTTTTAQTYQPGDDRWAKATALAAAAGCLLYFDPSGVLRLVPVPDPSTAPVAWRFATGQASLIGGAQNSLDRADAANVIVVTAQGSGVTTPLTSIASDDDPVSPTYADGPFGHVVKAISTSVLTTQDAVDAYAAAQLLLYAGATQQAQLTTAALWHLDAYDVIQADVGRVGLAGRYVIDQLSIPLGVGSMTLTTRGIVARSAS